MNLKNNNFNISNIGDLVLYDLTMSGRAGVAAARVQRVHLHQLISSNGCNAPVLIKNCPISGPFQSKKKLFQSRRDILVQKMWYNFKFWGCGITPLYLKNSMHPSCQVLGAAPAGGHQR